MKKFTSIAKWLVPAAAIVVVGCAEEDPGLVEWATTSNEIAPAGSDASLVSHTIPTTVAPNERLNVQVTMSNDGTAGSPGNDWDTAYRLTNLASSFFWGYTRVSAAQVPVTPTENADFNFVVTMPAAGTPTFNARMYTDTAGATGFFGDTVSVPLTVSADPNFRRRWGCQLVSSNIPASMNQGATQSVTITVENSGTADWPAGNFCLYARDTPTNLWGARTCVNLTQTIPGAPQLTPGVGNTVDFTFNITAPTNQTGPVPFRRQMFHFVPISQGGVGFFDVLSHCVDTTINVVGATPPYDAAFDAPNSNIDDVLMSTWEPGETRRVRVTMDNTGLNDWLANGDFRLLSTNTPSTLWFPVTSYSVGTQTPSGSDHTFTMVHTAPAAPGVYNSSWRMWSSSASPNTFGPSVSYPMNVAAGAQRQFDAAVVSQVIPASLDVNQSATFRITLRNTGWEDWSGTSFRLTALNSNWGTVGQTLPMGTTVTASPGDPANGGTYEFVIPVTAPPTAGTYQSRWQLVLSTNPAISFGGVAQASVDVVVGCGNGLTQVGFGEECDDGNTADGDGCSSACLIEPDVVDLAAGPADRSFHGRESARLLSHVAIGDLNADGVADVAAGSYNTTLPAGLPGRALGGSVYVQMGGGTFFDGTSSSIATGALTEILGERSFDYFGGGAYSSVVIGDVTGDGIADLIASAQQGACANGMGTCGRVYVIRGGTDFPTGVVDLATPPANVVAILTGVVDGDAPVAVAVGELTGDANGDLVVGLPGEGNLDGRVVVVAGGPALAGVIELNAGNVAAEVLPAGLDEQLGLIGAIGRISADAQPDLIVASGRHDPAGGGQDAGGVWAIFGPMAGTYNLAAGGWNARWLGAGIRDRLGSSVSVANVAGSANGDVVIGVEGTRFAGNIRFGTADVWVGPIADTVTFDLSAGATPGARIQGREAGGGNGRCVLAADLNGDGIGDIITGGPYATGSSGALTQAGEVGVVLGGPTLASEQLAPGTSPAFIYGGQTPARTCFYAGGLAAGDLDGDGRNDFCVNAPMGSDPGSGLIQEGRVDCWRSRW